MGNDGKKIKDNMKKNGKKDVGLQQERSCTADIFYGQAVENILRLSFGEEGIKSSSRCSGIISDDLHDEMGLSPPTCRNSGAKDARVVQKGNLDFSHMVLDLKKMRDSNRHVQTKRGTNGEGKAETANSKVLRRDCNLANIDYHQLSYSPNKVVNYPSSKGADKNKVGENGAEADPNIQNSSVKDIMEVKTVKLMQISKGTSHRSPSSTVPRQYHDEASTNSTFIRKNENDLNLETLQGLVCKIGETKLEELSFRHAEERNSTYISKELLMTRSKNARSSKVKIYSPRTPSKAELCKIRALMSLRKTRMKMRVREEEKERALLESFAVVKCSFDQQKDFRNSMLEMIIDKGLSQTEELEELLACYLTLNSDEYHGLIIKVFRKVWFDLNKDHLDPQFRS